MSKYEGHYIRIDSDDSAEITISSAPLASDSYHVSGLALYGSGRKNGPNTGELDFSAKIERGRIFFSDDANTNLEPYKLEINFLDDKIEVLEKSSWGYHGMNVTFQGVYKRASGVRRPLRIVSLKIKRLMSRI